MVYELTVIVLTVISLLIIKRFDEKVFRNFLIIFIGILLLQYFTQALWLTVGLSKWSYLYQGVNWIITLGRATMVIVSLALVDYFFPKLSQQARFGMYFIPILITGVIGEAISAARGTIQYHPELLNAFSGVTILGKVPIEALYYIPVFMLLIVSFAKYWQLVLDYQKTKKRGRKK
jgi:FlaA1/EpsC-like NDP-sugar epimerase